MPPHLTADAAFAAGKDDIRRRLRALRSQLDPGERERLSLAACGHILASKAWQRAATVALYMAVRGETDPAALLENAWQSGKTALLPACSRAEPGLMVFAPCPGPGSLCPGLFNIPEPSLPGGQAGFDALAAACGLTAPADAPSSGTDSPALAAPPAPDLIIAPGLAFDRNGIRLGMGGGYYDRLLSLPRHENSLRIGLAYAFQIVDSLPRQPWDVPVHAVCTEKGLVWIRDPRPSNG